MPNFKPKNQKVIKATNANVTLDTKHNDILLKFKKECDEIIPNNEKRIENLKNKLKEKKNVKNKLELHDEIKTLNKNSRNRSRTLQPKN